MEILLPALYAFLGGVILNVMPCVLPVLTMKVFHVLEQAGEDHTVTKKHSLAYSLGIMIFFWILCAVVVGFKFVGQKLYWGQQFQHPVFIGSMVLIMFAFGLNALGVFEITIGMGDRDRGEGYGGSVMNGLFAAVMATPCTAPGMGLCLPYALNPETSWWGPTLIFSLLGFGLAFPFLVISYIPGLGKRLPRPGPWMETFKKLMGFTLMAAAVWLFGVLAQQLALQAIPQVDEFAEMRGLVQQGIKNATWWGLGFLTVLAIVLWGQQHWGGFEHSERRRWTVRGILFAALIGSGFLLLDLEAPKLNEDKIAALRDQLESGRPVAKTWNDDPTENGHIKWVTFSEKRLDAELKRNRPVFLDFTAEWCVNCKRNEAQVLDTPEITAVFKDTKILAMKVDFTNEDEKIEKWIDSFGRAGVPIYVVKTPDGKFDLLPELITKSMVSTALNKAAEAFPANKFLPPAGFAKDEADAKPVSNAPGADGPDADKPDADKPDADKPDADKPSGEAAGADKLDTDKPKTGDANADGAKVDEVGAGTPADKHRANKPVGDPPLTL